MAEMPPVEMHVRLVFDGIQVRRGHVISMRPGDALAIHIDHNPSDADAWMITEKIRHIFADVGVPSFPILVFGPDQGLQVIRPGEIRVVELPDRDDEMPPEVLDDFPERG